MLEGHVAVSTQSQAFSALLFLYRGVLQRAVRLSVRPATGRPPRLASLLRHIPSGEQASHTRRPGTAVPQARQDDDDLHAPSQPRRLGRSQPAGLSDSSANRSSITAASRGPTFSMLSNPFRPIVRQIRSRSCGVSSMAHAAFR
jgi:hypothetical protein